MILYETPLMFDVEAIRAILYQILKPEKQLEPSSVKFWTLKKALLCPMLKFQKT